MSEATDKLSLDVRQAAEVLRNEVYGYGPKAFSSRIDVVESHEGAPELPIITRAGDSCRLTLSVTGAQVWGEIIAGACEEVGLETTELYVTTGIALLEIANVLHYSVQNKDPVLRLRKIDKAFRVDNSMLDVSTILAEHTGVNIMSIFRGLDQDDFAVVGRLRYGLGVALKAYGVEGKDVKRFAAANLDGAVNSINKYRFGVATYLSGAISAGEIFATDISSAELTEQMYSLDFPYLQVVSSIPMNVTMLLNK